MCHKLWASVTSILVTKEKITIVHSAGALFIRVKKKLLVAIGMKTMRLKYGIALIVIMPTIKNLQKCSISDGQKSGLLEVLKKCSF